MDELFREFQESFQNYVRSGADDRQQMLDSVLKIPVTRVMLMQAHDLAALLTVTARVVSVPASIEQAHTTSTAVAPGTLPALIEYPTNHAVLKVFIASLDGMVDGRKYLQVVVLCLQKASTIPTIKRRMWKPTQS
jgi:hypothetical protein